MAVNTPSRSRLTYDEGSQEMQLEMQPNLLPVPMRELFHLLGSPGATARIGSVEVVVHETNALALLSALLAVPGLGYLVTHVTLTTSKVVVDPRDNFNNAQQVKAVLPPSSSRFRALEQIIHANLTVDEMAMDDDLVGDVKDGLDGALVTAVILLLRRVEHMVIRKHQWTIGTDKYTPIWALAVVNLTSLRHVWFDGADPVWLAQLLQNTTLQKLTCSQIAIDHHFMSGPQGGTRELAAIAQREGLVQRCLPTSILSELKELEFIGGRGNVPEVEVVAIIRRCRKLESFHFQANRMDDVNMVDGPLLDPNSAVLLQALLGSRNTMSKIVIQAVDFLGDRSIDGLLQSFPRLQHIELPSAAIMRTNSSNDDLFALFPPRVKVIVLHRLQEDHYVQLTTPRVGLLDMFITRRLHGGPNIPGLTTLRFVLHRPMYVDTVVPWPVVPLGWAEDEATEEAFHDEEYVRTPGIRSSSYEAQEVITTVRYRLGNTFRIRLPSWEEKFERSGIHLRFTASRLEDERY